MANSKRNQREQALAFAIAQGRRPFMWRHVAEALGCGKARACIAMAALRELGLIERIGRPREGYHRLKQAEHEDTDYDWKPKGAKLEDIVQRMDPRKPYTTGDLHRLTGLPRTTIRRYLKALIQMKWVAPQPLSGGFVYYRDAMASHISTRPVPSWEHLIPTWSECRDVLKNMKAAWAQAKEEDDA